ncbi:hypothetical protein [Curtobacterium sp. 1544]|uniref:hypothetical protein n=1 Tax=Curtobacterium sp. 1544 TaxID=3156417 RepID=UPI003392575B
MTNSAAYLARAGTPRLPNGTNADGLFDLWEHYLSAGGDSVHAAAADIKRVKAFLHHIDTLVAAMRSVLWRRRLFVSTDLLGDILFESLSEPDPLLAVFRRLKANEATARVTLLFPLRGFGIRGAGLGPLTGEFVSFVDARRGYAFTPQTNNLQRTLQFVNSTTRRLGVHATANLSDLEHVLRSRGARWLERNPLLMVSIASASGFFYEQEFLQLGQLKTVAGALVMISRFDPAAGGQVGSIFSSRSLNNWQTLDTNHYLMLSRRSRRSTDMEVQPVPVHSRREVLELTDLNIEFSPSSIDGTSTLARNAFRAVNDVFDGYLANRFSDDRRHYPAGRVYAKWLESLSYFRRSVRDEGSWESVVGLATAFEMLLTDRYARGTAGLLSQRVKRLLLRQHDRAALAAAVERVYFARNAAVHTGQLDTRDVLEAQRAYVLCFIAVSRRRGRIPPSGSGVAQALAGL